MMSWLARYFTRQKGKSKEVEDVRKKFQDFLPNDYIRLPEFSSDKMGVTRVFVELGKLTWFVTTLTRMFRCARGPHRSRAFARRPFRPAAALSPLRAARQAWAFRSDRDS